MKSAQHHSFKKKSNLPKSEERSHLSDKMYLSHNTVKTAHSDFFVEVFVKCQEERGKSVFPWLQSRKQKMKWIVKTGVIRKLPFAINRRFWEGWVGMAP